MNALLRIAGLLKPTEIRFSAWVEANRPVVVRANGFEDGMARTIILNDSLRETVTKAVEDGELAAVIAP